MGIYSSKFFDLLTLSFIKFLSIENFIVLLFANQIDSSSFSKILGWYSLFNFSFAFNNDCLFPVSYQVNLKELNDSISLSIITSNI